MCSARPCGASNPSARALCMASAKLCPSTPWRVPRSWAHLANPTMKLFAPGGALRGVLERVGFLWPPGLGCCGMPRAGHSGALPGTPGAASN
eukprot:15449788-Alexandrium_andersonii.AAC.1